MRSILGFALAFAIGAVCRLARIPSPAPNALLGSLLVVAYAAQNSINGAKPCR
jgi:XapX domain-containing protein